VLSLPALRRYALSRSLFTAADVHQAIERLGFLQADPIRAPARAQDLILRQRVADYRAGDLERMYAELGVEEDFFINYGFVTRAVQGLMHPRKPRKLWDAKSTRRAKALRAYVAQKGEVHPRDVDAYFAHGTVTNYWGGSSSATTHLLDAMHYRGMLRIVRRDAGVRVYALREPSPKVTSAAEQRARIDALVDTVVHTYAPLPAQSLTALLARLRYAVPQWTSGLRDGVVRAKARLASAELDGARWYWPAHESIAESAPLEGLRLVAPFDPVVWDRRRFELFWGWPYRFEAYTPVKSRRFGYYALPVLWREQVVGWANVTSAAGAHSVELGYVRGSPPRERGFKQALDAELTRLRAFLTPP
jgi:uncharacterized protein